MTYSKKEEKFIRVEEVTLGLLAENEKKFSISLVAKRAKVSRAWIYNNFGGKTQDFLDSVAKMAGGRFASVGDCPPLNTPEDIRKFFHLITEKTLRDVDNFPWIPKMYFSHGGKNTQLGRIFREIEQKHLRELAKLLQRLGLSEKEAEFQAWAAIKMRLAVCQAWADDEEFRKMGRATAIRMMLTPLEVAKK